MEQRKEQRKEGIASRKCDLNQEHRRGWVQQLSKKLLSYTLVVVVVVVVERKREKPQDPCSLAMGRTNHTE